MNHAGDSPDGLPVEQMNDGAAIAPPLNSLAIVGSHPATRELAPYESNSFDIWLFNEAPQKPEVYKRWTASFQMHLPEVYSSVHNWVNKDHWNWLQQDHGDNTIWMQERDERVPNSKKFPLDEVLALVGMPYLRSTPAMALALGIYLGYTDIWLYGSELTSSTEYTYQAINYAFWIGFAKGRGVDLHLECWHAEFYDQPIYGYDGELQLPQKYFETRVAEIITEHAGQEDALKKAKRKLEKALDGADFEKTGELSLIVERLAHKVGEMHGARDEAQRYAAYTSPISRQEFERVSATAQRDGPAAESLVDHIGGKSEYVWNVWQQTGNVQAKYQLKTFLADKEDAAFSAGKLAGVFAENLRYCSEYDQRVTSAIGKKDPAHLKGAA